MDAWATRWRNIEQFQSSIKITRNFVAFASLRCEIGQENARKPLN